MSNSTRPTFQALEQQIRTVLMQQPDQLSVAATPEFPLVFNAQMPPGHGFEQGNIGIRFSAMSMGGLQQILLDKVARGASSGDYQMILRIPELTLQGQYSVDAINSPKITLDHGGSMMDFDDAADYQPAGTTDGSITPLTPEEKAAMLDQARAQRQSLRETPNGQALLNTFNEHNEIFNTVFVTSPAARIAWAAGGATQAMAVDTHVSVTNDSIVNPKGKLYGPNLTYNSNAFNQQLQIVVNTISADPNFNPWDPDSKLDPDSKYVKASLAAMTFSTSVNQTGNDKVNVTELTRSHVFTQVEHQSAPAPATVDQLQNIIDQGAGAGGAVEAAHKNNWQVLDEEDRGKVRRFLFQAVQERLLKMNLKPAPLWQGPCSAKVSDVMATVDVHADTQGNCQIQRCQFDIPAFALEIDDSAWVGEAAEQTRQRLNQIFFIKRLLHDKVQQGLRGVLDTSLASVSTRQLELAAE